MRCAQIDDASSLRSPIHIFDTPLFDAKPGEADNSRWRVSADEDVVLQPPFLARSQSAPHLARTFPEDLRGLRAVGWREAAPELILICPAAAGNGGWSGGRKRGRA